MSAILAKLSARVEAAEAIVSEVHILNEEALNEVAQSRKLFEVLSRGGRKVSANKTHGVIDLAELKEDMRRNQLVLALASDGMIYAIAGVKEILSVSVTATIASIVPGSFVLGQPLEDRVPRMFYPGRSVTFFALDVETAGLIDFVVWPRRKKKARS